MNDIKIKVTDAKIPRKPWVLSKQYGMTFILSQDNEIVIGSKACEYLGDYVLKYIIEAVNNYSVNRLEESITNMLNLKPQSDGAHIIQLPQGNVLVNPTVRESKIIELYASELKNKLTKSQIEVS